MSQCRTDWQGWDVEKDSGTGCVKPAETPEAAS